MLDACVPDVIINLAALTNVDTCEAKPQQAYLLNVKVVENLVDWIRLRGLSDRAGCHLVHVSSDQVYDVTETEVGPHTEDSVTVANIYAFSKIASELAALQAYACVLRTNFFGKSAREGRASFSDWLAKSFAGGAASHQRF